MSKTITIHISEELDKRISDGPLRATGGRGKSTWALGLILAELDRLDGYTNNGKKRPRTGKLS